LSFFVIHFSLALDYRYFCTHNSKFDFKKKPKSSKDTRLILSTTMTVLKELYKSVVIALLIGSSLCVSEEVLGEVVCTLDHGAVLNERHVEVDVSNAEVNMEVTRGDGTEGAGYWILNFNKGQFKDVKDIRSWCVDIDRRMKAKSFSADIVSSLDADFFEEHYRDAVDRPEILPSVNWIINNRPTGTVVTIPNCVTDYAIKDKEFQIGVWLAIDKHNDPYRIWNKGNGKKCVSEYIRDLLNSSDAKNYEPDCRNSDEKFGIMLVVDNDKEKDENGDEVTYSKIQKQVLIGEVLLRDTNICECIVGEPDPDRFIGASGDPHFKTWAGEAYDFHGVCDLVLLSNPSFENGLGMDIHIRTTRMRLWSYISLASVRIGEDILEVKGGDNENNFWINGIVGTSANTIVDASVALLNGEGKDETTLLSTFSGYPITLKVSSAKQREFIINIRKDEKIVFTTWNSFVGIHFKHHNQEHFRNSIGLMGSFPKGIRLARDSITVLDNLNNFGQEWQVLASEPKLFHDIQGPQQPTRCEIPTNSEMRRRLEHGTITLQDAKKMCAHVSEDVTDFCIFDVMATSDKSTVGAY